MKLIDLLFLTLLIIFCCSILFLKINKDNLKIKDELAEIKAAQEIILKFMEWEFMIYLQEVINNQKLLLTAIQTGMIMFLDIQKEKNKTNKIRREAELTYAKTKLQLKIYKSKYKNTNNKQATIL